MPFRSKAQLQACYRRKDKRWNCNEWLKETPSVCCLPYQKGGTVRSRCIRKGERIKGPVQVGPRGGKYFVITEKDKKGNVCEIKVYV
jgi:hypothetical protein